MAPGVTFCYSFALGMLGVWRSLVAHFLREEGVGGSNPLTPTNIQSYLSYVDKKLWHNRLLWLRFVPVASTCSILICSFTAKKPL